MTNNIAKLNFLLETKKEIKDAINKSGGYVDDNTKFRAYAESILKMNKDKFVGKYTLKGNNYSTFNGASIIDFSKSPNDNSGFVIPQLESFIMWTLPFEIGVKFKNTKNDFDWYGQALCGSILGKDTSCPSIEVLKGGILCCNFPSADGNSSSQYKIEDYILPINTWLFAIMQWDGEKVTLKISEDNGNTFIKTIVNNTDHKPYLNTQKNNFAFGSIMESSNHKNKHIIIDFNNTYVKINDNVIFGMTRDLHYHSCIVPLNTNVEISKYTIGNNVITENLQSFTTKTYMQSFNNGLGIKIRKQGQEELQINNTELFSSITTKTNVIGLISDIDIEKE